MSWARSGVRSERLWPKARRVVCSSVRLADGSIVDCQVQMRRVEFVGPQVGGELTEKGGLAMLYALIGILVYVAFRFEWRFAVGAVIALVHDVVITLGVFSFLAIEFSLPVLAAVLAVIGYSLNDTIVVFDRIRDNFRKMRKGTVLQIMNRSVNETLPRTVLTSVTTLLVVLTLLLAGGEIIKGICDCAADWCSDRDVFFNLCCQPDGVGPRVSRARICSRLPKKAQKRRATRLPRPVAAPQRPAMRCPACSKRRYPGDRLPPG